METLTVRPSRKYLNKSYLTIALVAVGIVLCGLLIGGLITTVTNMKINRGPLDRLFGLGSLQIQTAGVSGSTQAEQHLVGLEDPQAVYDVAVQALRRFRGSMSPTAADIDEEDLLRAILDEVRGIRESLNH